MRRSARDGDDLARYLCRATRGLRGEHRAVVRAELESHVEHRARNYRLLGLDEREAVTRALDDLGPAASMGLGLARVYTAPRLARPALLAAALASALALLPSSEGGVRAVRYASVAGRNFSCLSLPGLRRGLEGAGMGVSGSDTALRASLPGAARPWTIAASRLARGEGCVDLDRLIEGAASLALPVKLSGLRNPRLSVGRFSVSLGTRSSPLDAYPAFVRVFGEGVSRRLGAGPRAYTAAAWQPAPAWHRHALRVAAPEGTAFGVATRDPWTGGLWIDVSEVTVGGRLEFRLPFEHVEFTDQPLDLLSNERHAREPGREPALVLRWSGRVEDFGVSYEAARLGPVRSDALR